MDNLAFAANRTSEITINRAVPRMVDWVEAHDVTVCPFRVCVMAIVPENLLVFAAAHQAMGKSC